MQRNESPNYINHIALAIDVSASMTMVQSDVVRVVDAEIAHLAQRSKDLGQETRVTVYLFNHEVTCLFYDKDVLRLPSIARYYMPHGMTALIDATMQSQLDLEKTAQLYGDHAFLTYVITDGEENRSSRWTMWDVKRYIENLAENQTIACLVPHQSGKFSAKAFGFPADNIAIWDATTARGVEIGFSSTMRDATETFMTNRSKGIRGSKTIFAGGDAAINSTTIRATMGFKRLPKEQYTLLDVRFGDPVEIRPFVEERVERPYRAGSAYYQLTKPEKIQPQKSICVRNRKSGRVYVGDDARRLLNLPDHEVRVKPEENGEFQIFVQSTSVNRKLVAGTKILVMKA